MSVQVTIESRSSTTPSVVVVDDEPAILAAVTSLLRRQAFAIHTFESSLEALKYLDLHSATIILSDMRMPDIDGSELLTKAAVSHPDSIRIMMTGYEDKDVIFDAINKGIAQYYVFKPWDDAALRDTIVEAIRLQNELRGMRLKEGLKSLSSLPSPSKFQSGLWEVLAKPDASAHDLARQIEGSPALVARVLRTANSVFFGARQRITTVLDAIRLIGVNNVAAMAVAVESFDTIGNDVRSEFAEDVDRIWEQSLRRAMLAKSIGGSWGGFQHMQTLHIASLLQEIGMVVQLCSMPEQYARYRAVIAKTGRPHYVAEQEILGVTHDFVGEAVLDYWSFPKVISAAVGRHHREVEGDDVTTILQISSILDNEYEGNPHDPSIDGLIDEWRKKISH